MDTLPRTLRWVGGGCRGVGVGDVCCAEHVVVYVCTTVASTQRESKRSRHSRYADHVPARDRRPPADYTDDPERPFTNTQLRADAPAGAVAAHTIARTIETAMTERGLTLRALAAQTGVDHSSISRIIRGHTYPDVDTLATLQATLGVHLWPPAD